MTVDLAAKPFHLDADAERWVRETIASLTLEEKVGQLFINLNISFDERYLDNVIDRYHVGGMRYRGSDSGAFCELVLGVGFWRGHLGAKGVRRGL